MYLAVIQFVVAAWATRISDCEQDMADGHVQMSLFHDSVVRFYSKPQAERAVQDLPPGDLLLSAVKSYERAMTRAGCEPMLSNRGQRYVDLAAAMAATLQNHAQAPAALRKLRQDFSQADASDSFGGPLIDFYLSRTNPDEQVTGPVVAAKTPDQKPKNRKTITFQQDGSSHQQGNSDTPFAQGVGLHGNNNPLNSMSMEQLLRRAPKRPLTAPVRPDMDWAREVENAIRRAANSRSSVTPQPPPPLPPPPPHRPQPSPHVGASVPSDKMVVVEEIVSEVHAQGGGDTVLEDMIVTSAAHPLSEHDLEQHEMRAHG